MDHKLYAMDNKIVRYETAMHEALLDLDALAMTVGSDWQKVHEGRIAEMFLTTARETLQTALPADDAEKEYTPKEIKETFLPNRSLESLEGEDDVIKGVCVHCGAYLPMHVRRDCPGDVAESEEK